MKRLIPIAVITAGAVAVLVAVGGGSTKKATAHSAAATTPVAGAAKVTIGTAHSALGTYPSLGPGENLGDQIHSLAIGHGLFSLIDAFPFQHPESPELSVSIPVGTANPADAGRARLFGQGAKGSFDNFEVTTDDKSK